MLDRDCCQSATNLSSPASTGSAPAITVSQAQPFKGLNSNGSLHITIQTGALIETHQTGIAPGFLVEKSSGCQVRTHAASWGPLAETASLL